MTSWPKPTDDQVDQVLALINEPEHLKHFFDALENPEWIVPLKRRGLFEVAPEAIVHGAEGTISYPAWPQSRYLARMAPEAADRVFAIVRKLVGTKNISVRGDLVDAALGLPGALAAQLVAPFMTWFKHQPRHAAMGTHVAERLGKLIVSLATHDQAKAAIKLLKLLLAVEWSQMPGEGVRRMGSREEAVPRIDLWQYQRILKEDAAELAQVDGAETVHVLCTVLSSALRITRGREAPPDTPDYSSIWRPAIEPHEQNVANDHNVSESLVSGVRDITDRLVATGSMALATVVSILCEYERPVFRRLALYLLRRHGEQAPGLVAAWLTDRDLFDETEVHHEYTALAADYFGSIGLDLQATILGWIHDGPNRAETHDRLEQLLGRPPTDDEVSQRVRLYQWRHLAPIAEHIPEHWRSVYRTLVAEFGEPEHPLFLSYTRVRWGDQSPIMLNDMRAMTVEKIVGTIQTWRASGDPFGPNVEGLAQTVGQIAREEPGRLAQQANLLRGLDPPYIRHFAHGLREAVSAGKPFGWEPVLQLSKWAVDQPRDLGHLAASQYMDPHWGWARGAIANLLYVGLDAGLAEIPLSLRELTWEVLVRLTRDPEPADSAEHDAEDVQSRSLNTVRGEAMHAVMQYALWLRRGWEEAGETDRLDHGFEEMPEVRQALEDHLDVRQDPSPVIRAVYGQWFAWLMLFDEEWTSNHVVAIFPPSEDEIRYWRAAWETYVVMSPPFDSAWTLLRDEYARAVDRLQADDEERRPRLDPAERLAEHLMVHYWRGNLDFGDYDHLLERFFIAAPERVRAHALVYVGQSLHNTSEEIPVGIVARLERLWEQRLYASQLDRQSHREEIAAFGWWYWAGSFDEEWALSHLQGVLRQGDHIDMDDAVVERLARVAPDLPLDAVQSLQLLVEKVTDPWTLRHWLAEMRTILQAALESDDAEAQDVGRSLIEELGRRGHHDYRDLRSLAEAPPTSRE